MQNVSKATLPRHGHECGMEGECGVDGVFDSQPMSQWRDEHRWGRGAVIALLLLAIPPALTCPLMMLRVHSQSPGHVWQGCCSICSNLLNRRGESSRLTPQPTSKIILSEGLTEPHATLRAFSDKGGLASSTLSEILCSCQTL